MSESIKHRIEKLRAELNHHNHLYYIDARPEISDRAYDKLMQELIDLEREHPDLITLDSPTQRVGGNIQTELKPVRHAVPMMSIDNTYSEAEVRAFDERVRKALDGEKPVYVLEPKIDGASVNLRYEKGKLVQAATRGRGNVGDDITVNARTIRSVPLALRADGTAPPPILEVRGEVYMDNDDFQRVNKEIVAEGEEPYANPRNLASGTLRRLDPKIVAKRRLRFLTHGLGQVEPMPTESYWEWTKLLRKWGLPLPKETWKVDTIDEAIECIHKFEKLRPALPYMTDGMVMKVDSFPQREQLGATSKAPRWVIAFKYETEQQPTVLREVDWQVGKGGTLTPVARLEPVFVGGTTISNVSLHNIEQIRKHDIHLGDTVVIERAGEVIPYVSAVLVDRRPNHAKRVPQPTQCPSCGEKVEKEKDGPYIRCVNSQCPAQLRERLKWFCARGQMDIDGLGESIIDQLLDRGMLKSYGDIFRLRAERIATLTHETAIGEKTAAKIVEAIKAGKRNEGAKVPLFQQRRPYSNASLKAEILELAGPKHLNIKGLGEKTVDQMISRQIIKSPADLFAMTAEELASLPREVRVGEKTAGKIIKSVEAAKSRGLAHVLAALGIPHVGTTVARNVAKWAGSIQKLRTATVSELHSAAREATETTEDFVKVRQLAHEIRQAIVAGSKELKMTLRHARNIDQLTPAILELAKASKLANRVRESRAEQLASSFEDGESFLEATDEEIADALKSEQVIAGSLYHFLHSIEGERTLHELEALGVKLTEDSRGAPKASAILGKSVVITGSFTRVTRDQLSQRLSELGAKVSSSVSSKTDIVFVGAEPGSKLEKAKALGISVWDEQVIASKLPEAFEA